MANRRIIMSKIKKIIKYYQEKKLSKRGIAKLLNVSRDVVSGYLYDYRRSGLTYKEFEKIQKNDLLLLDDFGLEHLSSEDRLALLEILEDRYSKKSTIIISQIPITKWFEIIACCSSFLQI